jgi:AraC-like DNA-binding protein
MLIAESKEQKFDPRTVFEAVPGRADGLNLEQSSTRFTREVKPGRHIIGVANFKNNLQKRSVAPLRSATAEVRVSGSNSGCVFTSGESRRNVSAERQLLKNRKPTYMFPDIEVDHRVKMVIRFIEENGDRQLSLNEIAQSINVSPWHLCRLFRTGTGTSVNQYLLNLRMQKAKELLETTCLRVKEIMNQVGIRDESHFARTFKKLFGVSPSQYRAMYWAQPSALMANNASSGNPVATLPN